MAALGKWQLSHQRAAGAQWSRDVRELWRLLVGRSAAIMAWLFFHEAQRAADITSARGFQTRRRKSMSRIDVRQLGFALGAQVTGIDLRQPLDDLTRKDIVDAWQRHLVLVFPDQDLDAEQQTVSRPISEKREA
jgi:hypothetical protein